MDFESRSIKAGGNVGVNCCFTLQYRLSGKNKNGVITPIRYDLPYILSRSSQIRPLRIPAQQFIPLNFGIEMSPRTTNQNKCEKNRA